MFQKQLYKFEVIYDNVYLSPIAQQPLVDHGLHNIEKRHTR